MSLLPGSVSERFRPIPTKILLLWNRLSTACPAPYVEELDDMGISSVSLSGDNALTVLFGRREGGARTGRLKKFDRLWSIVTEIEDFAKIRNSSMNSTAENSDGIYDGKRAY
jgi:hypothetical protein